MVDPNPALGFEIGLCFRVGTTSVLVLSLLVISPHRLLRNGSLGRSPPQKKLTIRALKKGSMPAIIVNMSVLNMVVVWGCEEAS